MIHAQRIEDFHADALYHAILCDPPYHLYEDKRGVYRLSRIYSIDFFTIQYYIPTSQFQEHEMPHPPIDRSLTTPDGRCPFCKGAMESLVSVSNPSASEWYCQKCHESVYMTQSQVQQHLGPAMRASHEARMQPPDDRMTRN